MKKALCMLLALIFMVGAIPAFADEGEAIRVEYENITYEVREDGLAAAVFADKEKIWGEVIIPENVGGWPVTELFDFLFKESDVSKVVVPQGIKKIGCSAFENCKKLKEVSLPEGLEVIDQFAFNGCESLKEMYIPQSTKVTGDIWAGCKKMERITVHPDNKYYSSDDQGILYNKEGDKIIRAPQGIKGIIYIPEGVKEVSEGAFYGCESLIAVVFPKSMELLDHQSFGHCQNLQTLVFYNPNTVISGEGSEENSEGVKYAAFNETQPKTVYGYEGGSVYDEFTGNADLTFVPFEKYEKMVATASEWAEPYIFENDVMGVVTDELCEDWTRAITREEFCEALIKALAYYLDYDFDSLCEYVKNVKITNNSIAFTDCYNRFVLLAARMKIVNGKGGGRFAPSDSLTREEAAVMLARARWHCLHVNISYSEETLKEIFDDYADISEWAKDSVGHVKRNGVMEGVEEKIFDPKGTYTREQAMTAFARLFDSDLAKDGRKIYQKTHEHYDTRPTYDRFFDYHDRHKIIKAKKVLETEYGTVVETYTVGVMHGYANELELVKWDGETVYLTVDVPYYNIYSPMRWKSLELSDDGKILTIIYPTIEEDHIFYMAPQTEGRVLCKKGTHVITANLETGEVSSVDIP